MSIVIYEKKSKNHIFFKNPYVPQMVGKLCVWVFKTIFLNYLTIPTYVPNLEVLLTAKTDKSPY